MCSNRRKKSESGWLLRMTTLWHLLHSPRGFHSKWHCSPSPTTAHSVASVQVKLRPWRKSFAKSCRDWTALWADYPTIYRCRTDPSCDEGPDIGIRSKKISTGT